MAEPMWPPTHEGDQAHRRRGQERTHNIVRGIPFTEMAAVKHREDDLSVLRHDIHSPKIVVKPMRSELADKREIATATAVCPQITARGEHRNPAICNRRIILNIGFNDISRTDERFETPIATG